MEKSTTDFEEFVTILKIYDYFTVNYLGPVISDTVILFETPNRFIRCVSLSYLMKKKENYELLMDYVKELKSKELTLKKGRKLEYFIEYEIRNRNITYE